jgi:phosphatidylinositol glycan class V
LINRSHRIVSPALERSRELHHLYLKVEMVLSLGGRSATRTVISLAVASRLLLAALFILWRNAANPYDTSADLSLPCLSNSSYWIALAEPEQAFQQQEQELFWGKWLGDAIQRTVVWDGVYYVRIAECGYEYEQSFAFSPTLPLLMRLLSRTSEISTLPVKCSDYTKL